MDNFPDLECLAHALLGHSNGMSSQLDPLKRKNLGGLDMSAVEYIPSSAI